MQFNMVGREHKAVVELGVHRGVPAERSGRPAPAPTRGGLGLGGGGVLLLPCLRQHRLAEHLLCVPVEVVVVVEVLVSTANRERERESE